MDLSTTSADEATITFTIGDSTSNQYKIKVMQYSCDDPHISAQAGCFQYFVGQSGTIESYNLANTAQLSTLDYNNCIRQELGYCCIEYSVSTFTLSKPELSRDQLQKNICSWLCDDGDGSSGQHRCFYRGWLLYQL